MKIRETANENYQIDFIQDYAPNMDIFNESSAKAEVLKHIIFSHLSYNERVIFLLYVECSGNYSKMANYIKIDSKRNLYIYISNIKKKIKTYYDNLKSSDN